MRPLCGSTAPFDMQAMQSLFDSGLLVDLVIALTVLEGLALALYHRATGRGIAPQDYALNLVSGLCLMLAVRAAVSDVPWPWIAVCLSASGLAHGWDMVRRWRHRQRATTPPLPATSLPGKIAQGPAGSAGLPEYTWQLLHIWVAACLGNFLASTLVVS
eukprot:gene39194-62828_t